MFSPLKLLIVCTVALSVLVGVGAGARLWPHLRAGYQLDPLAGDLLPNQTASQIIGPRLVDEADQAVKNYLTQGDKK